jgi:CRISPR-associated protein Cas2
MRVIVFFDLPTETTSDMQEYRKFRKFLIKGGFIMLQESVYSKLAFHSTQVTQIISEIKHARPEKGSVQILTVTEKQYARMELLSGTSASDVIDTDERLLIL